MSSRVVWVWFLPPLPTSAVGLPAGLMVGMLLLNSRETSIDSVIVLGSSAVHNPVTLVSCPRIGRIQRFSEGRWCYGPCQLSKSIGPTLRVPVVKSLLRFKDPFLNTTFTNSRDDYKPHLIFFRTTIVNTVANFFRHNSVALFYPVQKWFVKRGARAAARYDLRSKSRVNARKK